MTGFGRPCSCGFKAMRSWQEIGGLCSHTSQFEKLLFFNGIIGSEGEVRFFAVACVFPMPQSAPNRPDKWGSVRFEAFRYDGKEWLVLNVLVRAVF